MFLDVIPGSSGKKRVSRSLVQKIKQGGKLADEIRKTSDRQHEENDIPQAERHLEDSLNKWPEQSPIADNGQTEGQFPHDTGRLRGGTNTKNGFQKILQKIKDFLWTEL